MSDNSNIEWTDATWNPVSGCTKIGAGCDNCYAEVFAERWRGVAGHYYENGFDLTLRPQQLEKPLTWKKPKMIFVNSMSDLFHKDIPKEYIDKVFDVMEQADWHVYQILTKRSSLMRNYVNERYDGRPIPQHLWFGVSVENKQVLSRIEHLRDIKHDGVRFLSIEPLLEDLGQIDLANIDWVIVGGESGFGARKMLGGWVQNVLSQCEEAEVPFFFKQWGGVNKKREGRVLNGRLYDGMPEIKKAGVLL